MLISCNSCNSKYLVNSAELKPDGRNVQCANCGNQWFQESQVFDDNIKEDLIPEINDEGSLKQEKNKKLVTLELLILLPVGSCPYFLVGQQNSKTIS